MRSVPLLSALLLAAPALVAQDLLVVTWAGQAFRVDSVTAASTALGSTGHTGHNALARDGLGRFWVGERVGTTTYHLATIDPTTGVATTVHNNVADLRGLTGDGSPNLLGIREGGDTLVQVDTTSGAVTSIGTTNFASIQGFADHQGVLYAWDINQGLLTIDRTTGAGTDVNTGVGNGSADIQWLCSHSDGRLLGGRDNLYVIDPATGVPTLIGAMGIVDSRGGEQVGGFIASIGTGCPTALGTNVLTGSGTPAVNNLLTFTSGPHAPSVLAVAVFGFSSSSYLGNPLPLSLDPILGTQGCNLYVSIDAVVSGLTTSPAPGTFTSGIFLTPIAAGATFYVQHATFEPVPGGLSTSNALHVSVAP